MVEMMKKVSVVRILVQIRGSVILKNWAVRPAPSRLAMVAKGMADVGLSFMYNQKDAGLYGYAMAAGGGVLAIKQVFSSLRPLN